MKKKAVEARQAERWGGEIGGIDGTCTFEGKMRGIFSLTMPVKDERMGKGAAECLETLKVQYNITLRYGVINVFRYLNTLGVIRSGCWLANFVRHKIFTGEVW